MDLKPNPALIFLLGATAVGKSTVALKLARSRGGSILALDAMQVYRGADIGTSKPSWAERDEIRHGGLDLVELGESFGVAAYLEQAATFLREEREAGRPVIIVGGTGLYFRAMTRGLCGAPPAAGEMRAELQALTLPELQERLMRVDPGMVQRLDFANPRRLVRAIEVKETTGRSLSDWQEETPAPLVGEYQAFWLERQRDELSARIAARVEAMFAAGWVDEVGRLVERHGDETVRRFPAIGYREICQFIAGEASREDAKSDILVATRQYAKRQLTWFAREPNLQKVMLSGSQPLPAVLHSLS